MVVLVVTAAADGLDDFATAPRDGEDVGSQVRVQRGYRDSRAGVASRRLVLLDASEDPRGHAVEAGHKATGKRSWSLDRFAVAWGCGWRPYWMGKRQSRNGKDRRNADGRRWDWGRQSLEMRPREPIAAEVADDRRGEADEPVGSCPCAVAADLSKRWAVDLEAEDQDRDPCWGGDETGEGQDIDPADRANSNDST